MQYTHRSPKYWLGTLGLLLTLFGSASVSLYAQLGTGTLNGTVTDTTGAVIPGATLTLTDTGTSVVRTTVADKRGHYSVPDVNIGRYRLTATSSGFGTATKDGIEVTVGAQLTVDVPLAAGSQSTTVDVSSDVQSEVNSTSGEQSTLISPQQIHELPLNGRNFEQLVLLAPGVQPSTGSPRNSIYGRSPSFSVSGARPEGQAELLDGANIQGYWARGSGASIVGTSLGIDGIAEFQILTGVYGAQFGGSGSVINAVTRSGTNNVHGSVYEFVRNSVFDARNYFDPASGPPSFRRNQFGGSVGFPIRHDRTFGFLNYEGLRQQLGELLTSNVPNVNARTGFLPCTLTVANAAVCKASGTTTAPNPSLNPYLQSFGVNAAVAPFLALFPQPNGTDNGDGSGRLTSVAPNPANEDYFQARVDQYLSSKDNLAFRYVSDNAVLVDPYPGLLTAGFPETSIQRNRFATIEEKHIFSPKLLNTARLHFTRTGFGARQGYKDPTFAALQLLPGRQYGSLFITSLLPSGSASQGFGPSVMGPTRFIQNRYALQDDAYLTVKSHQLQFGVDVTSVLTNAQINLFSDGQYTFANLSSFLTDSASALVFAAPGSNGERNSREVDVSPYIQDDWKVNAHLSVNVGLRYEFETNPIEANGKFVVLANPATDPAFVSSQHPYSNNPSLKNIDPRLGFSYAPGDGSTAIRGGVGIYHNAIQARTYIAPQLLTGAYNLQVIAGGVVPFPNPLSGRVGVPTASNELFYNGTTTPFQTEASLGVQQKLDKATVLTVSYVGNFGRHLFYLTDVNPPVSQICPCADPFNPTAAALPSGTRYFPVPGARGYVRGNTNFSSLAYDPSGGSSNYHSLQSSLVRSLNHGVQFQVNYTWSKALDISSLTNATELINGNTLVEDPFHPRGDYGPAAFDTRHVGTANLVYQLPKHGDNRFVNGWEATALVQLRSGTPYNVLDGFDRENFNNSPKNERANVVGNPNLGGPVAANPTCTAPATVHNKAHWYNPCAFMVQPLGTIGNERRDSLVAPGFKNLDMALVKNTRLGENISVEVRGELFNVFNHTNLGFPNLVAIQGAPATPANTPGSPAAGAVTLNQIVGYNPAAGSFNSTNGTSRQAQFALKVLF